jgi:hypothetical protein
MGDLCCISSHHGDLFLYLCSSLTMLVIEKEKDISVLHALAGTGTLFKEFF